MYTILTILLVLISVLLILVVLIQPGKGDMMTSMGAIGGSITSMFGTRKTMDLLTKITIGLAVAIMLLVVVTNKFFVGQVGHQVVKPVTEGIAIPTQQAAPPAPIQTTPPAQEPEQKPTQP